MFSSLSTPPSSQRTQLLLMPSQRDAHHPFEVYPQPPFQTNTTRQVSFHSTPISMNIFISKSSPISGTKLFACALHKMTHFRVWIIRKMCDNVPPTTVPCLDVLLSLT